LWLYRDQQRTLNPSTPCKLTPKEFLFAETETKDTELKKALGRTPDTTQ